MQFTTTDGIKVKINLGQYVNNLNTNPSSLHVKIRDFLKNNFPASTILEEVYIKKENIYLDFYLCVEKICIEGMGDQHDNFSLYMHKDKLSFARAKGRDNRKAEFCHINGIKLIYLYPDESVEQWMEKFNLKKV